MLVNITFSLNNCKNLSENELDNLSDTARDFFYFVQFILTIQFNSFIAQFSLSLMI